MPMQESDRKAVADGFEECWNFPNWIGGIDEEHIVMKESAKSCACMLTCYACMCAYVLICLVCLRACVLVYSGALKKF